jgi:multidrug efflux pump subunit AcrA (membrane-fusion protein)
MKKILCVITLSLGLLACSREPHVEGGHFVTLEPHIVANTLYYSGIIQPLNTRVITSPADSVVVEMPKQYGDVVRQGELLFSLSSSKFMSDYKSALMSYLKSKSDFNNSKTQLDEAEFLHKNELISDDDFKAKQTNYYASQLTLMQAKDVLETFIHQLNLKEDALYNLSIADVEKVNQAMHSQINADNLRILAPANGVLLASSKNEEENKRLTKGDMVKQGDVLAIIGDMSGLSLHIKVNELTVNQLKVGQKANITGIAFPEETLHGNVSRVDRQGEITNGAQPVFTVEVTVPKLTDQQQKVIHVGMTAKIEMNTESEPTIMAPITSVSEKNGESYMRVWDEKTAKVREVAVKTGKTTMDTVAILTGLKPGDKIVVPD